MSKNCNNDDVGSDCQWWVDGLCEHVETCGEPRKIELLKPGEHTPGPWRLSNYHYPHSEIVADRGSSDNDSRPGARLICRTTDNGKSPHEFKANARLIAAAPELLKACQGLISEMKRSGYGKNGKPFPRSIHNMKIAITKATKLPLLGGK